MNQFKMARSFSNAKLLSALVSNAITRRGYSAASQGVVSSGGAARSSVVAKKTEEAVKKTEKVSWIPDPVTGYYRPENGAEE
ncbi:hypothetical protein JF116_10125, partial [Campylobacter fetus subsp. venerealis]|nr:hypothetical protein [Campylobacter fetus subsp. venerealis]